MPLEENMKLYYFRERETQITKMYAKLGSLILNGNIKSTGHIVTVRLVWISAPDCLGGRAPDQIFRGHLFKSWSD